MYPFRYTTAPNPADFREFGLIRYASGVLLKRDMPSAMVEPVFMSYPGEAALLVQSIYDPLTGDSDIGCLELTCRRGQITQTIYQGILTYLGAAEPLPHLGMMHISALSMWYQQRNVKAFVYTQMQVQDQSGNPVPGATVSLATTLPDGSIVDSAATTGADGIIIFKLRTGQTGTFTAYVQDVIKTGWVCEDGVVQGSVTIS